MAMKSNLPHPFAFVPRRGKPNLLFVLLHGESASPEQLFPLAKKIAQAFPLAMVVLPYAYVPVPVPGSPEGQVVYHWVDPSILNEHNRASLVAQALPGLIQQIQQIQVRYELSGEQTALGGFSQGACMALEASLAQPDLAGRVLAFSGLYASQPGKAPPATLLHFFHGSEDQQVLGAQVQSMLAHLGELQADATLDTASEVGHELHGTLINQAIVRLTTCVPLRNWEAALGALAASAPEGVQAASSGTTLH
ncbi:esterase [Alcaligenaceae bacterium]|nr:esterase [Alcaligenaceae bacterium]